MSNNLLIPRFEDLGAKQGFNVPEQLGDFLVYFCLASQAHSSLGVTHQDSSNYKLKALKFMDVVVPKWLVPLVQSIGNYETNDGVISIKALEQLVPLWTLKSILAYRNLNTHVSHQRCSY